MYSEDASTSSHAMLQRRNNNILKFTNFCYVGHLDMTHGRL